MILVDLYIIFRQGTRVQCLDSSLSFLCLYEFLEIMLSQGQISRLAILMREMD
jgi:hypothetical protein